MAGLAARAASAEDSGLARGADSLTRCRRLAAAAENLPTSRPMSALEQLSAFVATHAPDATARAALRLHLADTIGAWIAACGTQEGRLLLAHGKGSEALADRLAVNVALARLSEI